MLDLARFPYIAPKGTAYISINSYNMSANKVLATHVDVSGYEYHNLKVVGTSDMFQGETVRQLDADTFLVSHPAGWNSYFYVVTRDQINAARPAAHPIPAIL
jgi:hypothetical protein